jgi:hypothetical protein
MKKALINPTLQVMYISSWNYDSYDKKYNAVYTQIENAQLVCDTSDVEFEVAQPLFWIDCNDSVVAYQYYLDTTDNLIKEIINAQVPEEVVGEQPTTGIESI